jgi:hypothetical protein
LEEGTRKVTQVVPGENMSIGICLSSMDRTRWRLLMVLHRILFFSSCIEGNHSSILDVIDDSFEEQTIAEAEYM